MLVSIITACFNSQETIQQTINSVYNQSYKNIEYIIIDGMSSDKTVQIIKNNEERMVARGIKYKWISEKDCGIYDAFNKGIRLANGELIGIINSDDWYEDDAIIDVIEQYDDATDIYHGILKVFDNQKLIKILMTFSDDLDRGEMIQHPTCFIKKTLYSQLDFYNTNYKSASDLEFMLRAKKVNVKFKPIFKILANFSIGGISSSQISSYETLKIRFKYGIISKNKYYKQLLSLFVHKFWRR